jgi:hypothetical protein
MVKKRKSKGLDIGKGATKKANLVIMFDFIGA